MLKIKARLLKNRKIVEENMTIGGLDLKIEINEMKIHEKEYIERGI
jgi:hypothetical protein